MRQIALSGDLPLLSEDSNEYCNDLDVAKKRIGETGRGVSSAMDTMVSDFSDYNSPNEIALYIQAFHTEHFCFHFQWLWLSTWIQAY